MIILKGYEGRRDSYKKSREGFQDTGNVSLSASTHVVILQKSYKMYLRFTHSSVFFFLNVNLKVCKKKDI